METIYGIKVYWVGHLIRGRVWRFIYKAKRRVAHTIDLWMRRVRRANHRPMFIIPAYNEQDGLDYINSDKLYQTDAEKRENKRVARRFFEVEFGWEG